MDNFEKEVISGFNERLEVAKKVVNILKTTSEKEKVVQKMEKKAVRMLVRHIVGSTATEAVPMSSSTEGELSELSSRRTVPVKKNITGSLIPKPRRRSSVEQEEKQSSTEKTTATTSDERVCKSGTTVSSILSSTQSISRIPVFSNKRKIAVDQDGTAEKNVPTIPIEKEIESKELQPLPQYIAEPEITLPRSAIEQLVPKLDFSSLRDESEKETVVQDNVQAKVPDAPLDNTTQEEKTTESDGHSEVETNVVQKAVESGGRTSRDVSSIGEMEPPPKALETDDEGKETDASVSTLRDDDHDSAHSENEKGELAVAQSSVSDEYKKQTSKSDDESVFSALPSSDTLTSGHDLQSLPGVENEQEKEDVQPTVISVSFIFFYLNEICFQHADSDPERLPSGSTVIPSAISSSKLADQSDSPVPSPPHVENSVINESEPKDTRVVDIDEENEVELLEDIKTPSEISDIAVDAIQSASESTASSTPSHVVVPKSLERGEKSSEESPVESAKTSSEATESSTTQVSSSSEATSSVGTTVSEKSTTEVSSSSTTAVESKSSSVSESIPEEVCIL